jgi:hypothetical protein
MSNLLSNKNYHYLYKTVNKINGKFYYGIHSTNNLEDGYLGSGTALRAAIRKYGKENFEITVLQYFDSRMSLLEAEKLLISEELIQNSSCYNLKPGGTGGLNSKQHVESFWKGGVAKRKWLVENDPEWLENFSEICRKSALDKPRGVATDKSLRIDHRGRVRSQETRQRISKAMKGKGVGQGNSQFGTIWITNGSETRKINNLEPIPDGWKKGRNYKRITH